MLFQKFDKISYFSFSVIINRLLFLASSEKFDGGESFDADSFDFVHGGVDFGDQDVFVGFQLGGQLFIFGGQRFAVSAPGRIELHQNVFGFIVDHGGEGFSHQDIYVFGLGGWNFLRFQSRFQRTGFVIFEEFQNVFGRDWTFQSELLNIFVLESDDHAQWAIFALDSDEFSQSLSETAFDLSFRHDDFSFQRSGSSFEFFLGLFVLGFVASKQMEKSGFLVLENDFSSFLVESHYCGDGVGFHEFDEGFG